RDRNSRVTRHQTNLRRSNTALNITRSPRCSANVFIRCAGRNVQGTAVARCRHFTRLSEPLRFLRGSPASEISRPVRRLSVGYSRRHARAHGQARNKQGDLREPLTPLRVKLWRTVFLTTVVPTPVSRPRAPYGPGSSMCTRRVITGVHLCGLFLLCTIRQE